MLFLLNRYLHMPTRKITLTIFSVPHTQETAQWPVVRQKCKMYLLLLSQCQISQDFSLINRTYTHTITNKLFLN